MRGPDRFSLCVDGEEFQAAVTQDIRGARERVYVQTLSFEGDRAGQSLSDSILSCQAGDRRILADSITEYLINDRFIYSPKSLADKNLRAEVRVTREMVRHLREGGVQVTMADPIGLVLPRLLIRNHKKIILVDDKVAYIGGINFSDHNFAWHDLMVRIESADVVDFLSRDFLDSWNGESKDATASFGDLDLYSVNGQGNESIIEAVGQLIHSAQDRIYIQCPYITPPFFKLLGKASRRGVHVTLVISEVHNRSILKEGIIEACRRENLHARYYRGRMVHTKAMLVDDSALVLGSANFDFSSFGLQAEIMGVFRDPTLIGDFIRRVVQADHKQTRPTTAADIRGVVGKFSYWGLPYVGRIYKGIHKVFCRGLR